MIHKPVVVLTSIALMVQGCTVAPPVRDANSGAAQTTSSDPEQACNPLVLGLVAGVGCGLISKSKNRAGVALACAAAAAMGCYLVNSYKAEQVKSAQQAENDYKMKNRQLPNETTIVDYRTSVSPRGTFSRSGTEKAGVTSYIELVKGKNDSSGRVEEEMSIVDSHGDVWVKPTRKVASETGQSGAYSTTFTLPIHDGMSQGDYTVKKTLYVNGKVTRMDQRTKIQVVSTPAGPVVAFNDVP